MRLPTFICLTVLTVASREHTSAAILSADVTGGRVEGTLNGSVASFKGIPFAAPPVDDLRWRAPQPVRPWDGVRKADAFAPAPMQPRGMAAWMGIPPSFSEDCLYLNVWTPAEDPSQRLPVMVWIYGGAFAGGATSAAIYEGTQLAKKGVVVVSVAYRVGTFGFLAHPELSRESGRGSGNYGLLDQIAGLEWVKKNITAFGGDPERVTIFGESAGAISVSMLTASPKAKGLFHRAISQSGGSFAPPKLADEGGQNVRPLPLAEEKGKRYLESLGAKDLASARRLPADSLVEGSGFWPNLDGNVLLGDQYELYTAGEFNDTPILVGTNSDEGAMFVRSGVKSDEFAARIRQGFGDGAEKILAAYPHATDLEALAAAKNIFRDSVFAWHTWAWARLQSRKGQGPAYVYYFDQRAPGSPDGANHAADLGYVFRNLGQPGRSPRPEDVTLSELMSSYWVNFAATGNPNGEGLPAWPAFSSSTQQVMRLDASPRPQTVPNIEQLKALDAYYAWRRQEAKRRKQ